MDLKAAIYSNKFDDTFMYTRTSASDYKMNGKKYFVTSGNIKMYFPCELAIHAPDGSVISSYWHSGTLIAIKILDMDSDGKEEIYAGGVNNKARSSCLAVFDPAVMKGCSFLTNPLNDSVKGTEKYYIVFPRTFFFSDFSGRIQLCIFGLSKNKSKINYRCN